MKRPARPAKLRPSRTRAKDERRIEYLAVSDLAPFEGNSRTHPPEQIEALTKAIQIYGFTNPILVDEANGIIAGHARLTAAMALGLETVPCLRLVGLTEPQKRALVIADNQIALMAGWDDAKLRFELGHLQGVGFDMTFLGFSPDSLAGLLTPKSAGQTDPDATPEPPAVPAAQAGDVWLLGAHRLTCGDSTDKPAVERLLAGARPNLMVTDPPYGVDYDPEWRAERGVNKNRAKMGKVANDDRADWSEAWALFPGKVAYVWCASMHNSTVIASLESVGLMRRSHIIWAKDRFTLGRGDYHWQHEPCWYAVRAKGKGHWAGDRKQTTLWQIANKDQDATTVHGTQKPVECMRRPILNNSSPGQAVYEPFMGSGTTLIAAETTGRICYGVELNPVYVDVAIERWQAFTGEEAVLLDSGETFVALKSQRLAA